MREEVAAHYRSKGYTIRQNVRVRGQSGAVHAVEMVAQGPLGNLVVAFEDAGGFEGPEIQSVRRLARDIGASAVVAARRFPDGMRRQAAQAGVVLLDQDALSARPAPEPASSELEYPPWPDGPVPRSWPTQPPAKSTDPGFWRYPRGDPQAEQEPPPAAAATRSTRVSWPDEQEAPATVEAVAAARPAPSAAPGVVRAEQPTATTAHDRSASFAWLEPREAPSPAHSAGTGGRIVRAPRVRAPSTGASTAGAATARWLLAAAVAGASGGAVLYGLLRFVG